ncbi:Rieske (2Fe-2S) protein [bacterium]|nr:Rieske (2Fe-2S) protein [bacterium]MBU1651755.1 Rieske (2Fe-2S) protein [bacterium]
MVDGEKKNRRGFLQVFLGGGILGYLGMILYPVVRFMIPPELPEAGVSSVLAAKVSEISPNQSKIFKFGRKPGILIRTPEGELKAYEAICTHLDCTVQYRSDMQIIWCACHNGQYDLNGLNIAGPPPRPLTPLEINIKGDDIYVSPTA